MKKNRNEKTNYKMKNEMKNEMKYEMKNEKWKMKNQKLLKNWNKIKNYDIKVILIYSNEENWNRIN